MSIHSEWLQPVEPDARGGLFGTLASERPKCKDFSISDQIFDRTSCIFDWYVGIDAVLVEEIYAIGSGFGSTGLWYSITPT